MPVNKEEMEKLAELMEKNPKLIQAAMSGMSQALIKELQAEGLHNQISPEVLASLGKIETVGDGINPVADDYVASAVSSVLHVVKVGVAELASDLAKLSKVNTKINTKLDKLNLKGIINRPK
ncbi:hypothetical protein [Bacillus sp. 165]|uniref:hypothetical protein n=1 Tax=Bacillus sp. 165 TaxID=1529117 RepID=UPI001ADBE4A5|nr:hypothetical protein [Bacillus sp. 165]MBO9129016.1 hypothetical protein [Bacillus sp. 165]